MSNGQYKKQEAEHHNQLYAAERYREKHGLHPGAHVPRHVYMDPIQRSASEGHYDQSREA